jgi:adenylyl-sulfate kinase
MTIWLTGLPSAGKSTIGSKLTETLLNQGHNVQLLDGDIFRAQSVQKLGFSRPDREINLRRIAAHADSLARAGITVVIASIAPYRDLRDEFRNMLWPFLEVFVNAPVAVCEERDVKGLYRRFRAGELQGLTGIDDVYEPPLSPDVECLTDQETVDESMGKILLAISLAGNTNTSDSIVNHHSHFSEMP